MDEHFDIDDKIKIKRKQRVKASDSNEVVNKDNATSSDKYRVNIPDKESHEFIIRYEEDNERVLLRKRQLFDQLSDNKLEYTRNGICDSFIKFGTPSLNTVIEDVQKKSEIQTKRLRKLLRRLKEEGEVYDERISYYKQYIKNGGDIDYYVEEGIKEWFYINKTNYLKFLKMYKNEDLSQTKAFNEYIKNVGYDKYTERIRRSEMVLRLY